MSNAVAIVTVIVMGHDAPRVTKYQPYIVNRVKPGRFDICRYWQILLLSEFCCLADCAWRILLRLAGFAARFQEAQ